MRIFNYMKRGGDYVRLSNRLLEIVNFVPKNSIVADVGTDHGYIPIHLIESGISKKVIATDISKNSLDKTIAYVEELDLVNYIETRLGDGLRPIGLNEVDTVIMAGMGGILIRDILEKDKDIRDSIAHFIFQPMVASSELRRYLVENDFQIIDEGLAREDDKFYEIIYAKRGKSSIGKNINYEIGERLIEKRHPLLVEFLRYKIDILEKVLRELEEKESSKSRARYLEIHRLKEEFQEVLLSIEGS